LEQIWLLVKHFLLIVTWRWCQKNALW